MSQPTWLTPAGSLGTIPEGIFYSIPLAAEDPVTTITVNAVSYSGGIVTYKFNARSTIPYPLGTQVIITGFDPDDYNGTYTVIRASTTSIGVASGVMSAVTAYGTIANVPTTVTYEVIAGQLPAGMRINESGILTGIPGAIGTVEGVPADISVDTTSKFAIRARNTFSLADRTFSLTVAVQNQPYFVTPAGTIAHLIEGDQIFDLAIDVYNPDIYGITLVRLVAGQLPPGLGISTAGIISGVITGYILPETIANDLVDYEFTLEVGNGQSRNIRTFNIVVYNRSAMTADNTYTTADNTYLTADVFNLTTPVMLTPAGSIGSTRAGNWYAYQFLAINVDGRPFTFVATGDIPTGLVLDPVSGFLYGELPATGINLATYDFSLQVYDTATPSLISAVYNYSLTVTGIVSGDIVWLTPKDLGSIINGATSTFYVEAINVSGLSLQYQLAGLLPGDDPVYNLLPQGLQLLPSGHIAGRCSFNTFALDNGTTTFDVRSVTTGITTFDLTFVFTVRAFSSNLLVDVNETFTIHLIRAFDQPYDNLYIQAMPPQDDRALLNSLLQSVDIFPPGLIYRNDDPNFGIASRVIYNHAYGLTADTLDNYVASLNLNHYWKNLVLGEIKTAQALDDLGNVLYEVVYSQVIDDLVNRAGESVGKSVNLPYIIETEDGLTQTVYPNSLINMRDQVIDVVGQTSSMLPRWMLSKQSDGSILGFTPAWVIAYTNPGQSGRIVYNIQTYFGDNRLNLVDFQVDRYELDNLLTKYWDRENQHWIPQPPTTTRFDFGSGGDPAIWQNVISLSTVVITGVAGEFSCSAASQTLVVGQLLVIGGAITGTGSIARFASPTTFKISATNGTTTFTLTDQDDLPIVTAPGTTTGLTVVVLEQTVSWVNNYNNTVLWSYGTPPGTIFDQGSMQFIEPVDMYTSTDIYNKYLMFPKRNIITTIPG